MGTRCIIKLYDEEGLHIIDIYNQYDGHPDAFMPALINISRGLHRKPMSVVTGQIIACLTALGWDIHFFAEDSMIWEQDYEYSLSIKDSKLYLSISSYEEVSWEGFVNTWVN